MAGQPDNRLMSLQAGLSQPIVKQSGTRRPAVSLARRRGEGNRLHVIASSLNDRKSSQNGIVTHATTYCLHGSESTNPISPHTTIDSGQEQFAQGPVYAQTLQTDNEALHISLSDRSVTINADLTARPLQSLSQTDYFDEFDARDARESDEPERLRSNVDTASRDSTDDEPPRINPNNRQPTLNGRGDVDTADTQGSEKRPATDESDESAKAALAVPDDDNFLSELDSITALSKSRSKPSVPQQYSHEVDAFQNELNSLVGQPGSQKSQHTQPEDTSDENETSAYKGTSSGLSSHDVFDRMNVRQPFANAFNLGSVNVGDRFDEFDVELDRQEVQTQSRIADELGLSDVDLVADLSEISSRAQPDEQTISEQAPSPGADEPETDTQTGESEDTDSRTAATEPKDPATVSYSVPVIRSSETLTPWAAGAAMLVAWQGQWPVDQLTSGAGPWREYQPLLSTTQPDNLHDWPLDILDVPEESSAWQKLLTERGPLLLGSDDQVLVLTKLASDTHLIQTDRGAMQVAFEDFEELLARLQLSERFIVAALNNESTPSGQAS